jgi:sensor histidine kinase regulating citrate/malate metabolism
MRKGAEAMPRRWSLAGQLLALQLVIVAVVVLVVAAVGLAESAATFRQVEGRRMLAVAESTAAQELVRQAVQGRRLETLAAVAARAADFSGASYVLVADANRTILASSEDRALVQDPLTLAAGTGPDTRSWVGVTDTVTSRQRRSSVAARVPVLSTEAGRIGALLGTVVVGRNLPGLPERIRAAAPNLLTYLGSASVLGVLGSLLVARRVKRQTLGLEPREIRGLVEHREAMLTGIKEGVIALDEAHRITLVNAEAHRLLQLPADCLGRTPAELEVDPALVDVLSGRSIGRDQVVLAGERILTLNRMPVAVREQPVGSVTTMRDLTELTVLQRELGVSRQATDALRAQAHEFANRLHTISGLIELGEYDDVLRYIKRLGRVTRRVSSEVIDRIGDPALAALLVAKASLGAERGIDLRVTETTRLGRIDDQLSEDLTTVVGNLVDNAFDALAGIGDASVEVGISEQNDVVLVTVHDSGPGVAPELVDEVFEHGFTTKVAGNGGRGFGLALTRSICLRRGGDVRVSNAGGAVFAARLPRERTAPS